MYKMRYTEDTTMIVSLKEGCCAMGDLLSAVSKWVGLFINQNKTTFTYFHGVGKIEIEGEVLGRFKSSQMLPLRQKMRAMPTQFL